MKRIFKHHKKSMWLGQSGTTLMETMVAAALMLFVVAVLTQVMSHKYRDMKVFDETMDLADLKALISWRISTQGVCDANFQNLQIQISNLNAPVSLTQLLYSAGGSAIVTQNARIPGARRNINVSTIDVRNFVRIGSTSEYVGVLQVSFNASTLIQSARPPITIPISVILDSSNRVKKCNTSDSSEFQGIEVYTWTNQISAYRTETRTIDLTTLDQNYSYMSIQTKCACWDDGDDWEKTWINLEFRDASNSNSGLLNIPEFGFKTSSGDFDESFSRATYNSTGIFIPKPADHIRYIFFDIRRNTTSCTNWITVKTFR